MVVTAELKGGKADIRIVDMIGEWYDTSSRTIRASVDEMTGKGVTEAHVYINSRGGDIFEAVEIANELERFEKVTIHVGSIAASAATYILAKFKAYTKAKKNSQFMIHRPSATLSGDMVSITARIKLLENTTNDYKKTYAEATGKTEDEIEALWDKGDCWMTADEAQKNGFIAEVIAQEQIVTAEDVLILEACGAPHIPIIKESQKPSTEMDKLKIIAALGLAVDATDEQIEAAAKDAKTKADKLATVTATAQTDLATNVTKLVAQAVTDKKITADMVPHYEKFATADYDSCKAAFEGMTGVQKPALKGGTAHGTADDTARASWTLEDYMEKAPEALAEMAENDTERFDRLNSDYFGKKVASK